MSLKEYQVLLVSSDKELASKLELLLKEAHEGQVFFHWVRTSNSAIQEAKDFPVDAIFIDNSLTRAKTATYLQLLKELVAPSTLFFSLCEFSHERTLQKILEMGFDEVLPKTDLNATLLRHAIRIGKVRKEMQPTALQGLGMDERDLQTLLPDLCKHLPIGVWKFDFSINQLEVSRTSQALLQLHQSIYTLPLSDFLRLVHPEDREAVRDFFSRIQKREKTFLFYRLSLDRRQSKKMLLMRCDEAESSENTLLGIQMEFADSANGQEAFDKVREISEWFLQHAVNILKNMSSSASLLIFKQITAIQQQTRSNTNGNSSWQDLKNISTLVDIYVTTTNSLMSHYVLQRGFPSIPALPFVVADLTALLESYFERKAKHAFLKAQVKQRGNVQVQIIAQPGLMGFFFYNLIKGAIKIALPNTSALFKHEHEEVNGIMVCDFTLQLKVKSICSKNQHLLACIKNIDELQNLHIENKEDAMALTSLAIGIVGLRSAGAKLQVLFGTKERLVIKTKIYAPVFSSNPPANQLPLHEPERILLLEPYAPHQLLIQNKLIQAFPHVNIDVFSSFEEAREQMQKKQYDLLLFYRQSMFMEEVQKHLLMRKADMPPLIFIASAPEEKEKKLLQQYPQVHLLSKDFDPEQLTQILSAQPV